MREKFGRFVLLEEVDQTGLGTEYRAAKLGPTGFERLVSLIRLTPALGKTPDVAKDLLEHVKQAAQLQNPYILKIHGIGKIEAQYYVSYEFLEARNLRTILSHCRQEGFPFSVNHTLLIASKMCAALDYAQSRKTEDGRRFTHGLMSPSAVLLSNDGEVRVRFFGVWPSRVREAGVLREDERAYLAPEQRSGGLGDVQSDVYSVGAVVFECLTGERFQQTGREEDVATRIANARLQDPSVDPRTIPKPIADILKRALAQNSSGRYIHVEEMRKAIDLLLFSGDFTPTTFNLAFLMHSLFREQLDREAKLIKQEREANYAEFMGEDTASPTTGPVVLPPPPKAPPSPPEIVTLRREAAPQRVEIPRAEPTIMLSSDVTEPHAAAALREMERSGPVSLKTPRRSPLPLIAGGVGALVVLGGLGYWLLSGGRKPEAQPSPNPEAQAALARVQELEAKLKAIEDERLAAEEKAANEAKAKLEAQAKQRGQVADPAAVQRAQEEAARKARVEQEQRNLELTRQLEQQRQAEAARAAQAQRAAAEATPVPTPVPTPTAAPTAVAVAATPTPATAAPVVPASDPPPLPAADPGAASALQAALVPPTLLSAPRVNYPPVAVRQRIEGVVEIRAFVDDRGIVTETQVSNGVAGKTGLNEAAIENVKQRKYRPATRGGTPVGTWITVRVEFRLPR